MATKHRSLIVVADRETARFFLHTRPGEALEAHGADLERPSPGDRSADRPGRSFDSFGEGRHAMQPPTSYQDQERQAMAHAIVERLRHAVDMDEADRLVLIAEPKLLGELRSALAKPLHDRVVLEIDSHLTQASVDDLARRLTDEGTIGLVRASSGRAASN